MQKELKHYGMPRRSGRYPWGSGDDPYQSGGNFLSAISDLKKQGMSEVDIAKGFGITTSQLRAQKTLAREAQRKEDYSEALRLKDKGYSISEIGRRMDKNESSVRSLLNPAIQQRAEITVATSEMLKNQIKQKDYIDIGLGVESHLGISGTKLNTAIAQLKEQGYKVYYVNVKQLGTDKPTTIKVLGLDKGLNEQGKDIGYVELYKDPLRIRTITEWSEDGGRSFLGLKPPLNVSSDRIMINYSQKDSKTGEEIGGGLKDGVIELRRGVDDISLGNSKYAQVRISVDGTHYLKGMAIYSDDLPNGVDIRFNTNKSDTGSKMDAMKVLKEDPDNPFGSTVRQKLSPDGKTVISALNIVNEEGDWDDWSRTISSQVLSKQTPALAKKQLSLAYDIKKEEYDGILALTNPVVRKQLLEAFADDCDSSAVHLKAAALPRQASKVILPIPTLKENEIYAPDFKDGETVVLIRHPHGGTFEIPFVTVNNKSKDAQRILGATRESPEAARDAIGIHPKVAQQLSGADFDGDTVIVIPSKRGTETSIKISASEKILEDFDPKIAYPAYDGMPKMSSKTKQTEMGKISNLITDMTIKGAHQDEIIRAVKHSMVVIDAEKHNLNYKQSAIDNRIASLKERYQGGALRGASTLISRASSEIRVYERKEKQPDPVTGKRVYEETGTVYVNKKGVVTRKTTPSTQMAEEEDAFRLSSGMPMESIYANYANQLKSLANSSRKEAIAIKPPPMSQSAKTTYATEVASLNAQLKIALMNKPMERQAQLLANSIVKMKQQANPDMDKDDIKKVKNQALAEARVRTGASKHQIDISDKEWEAIQARAVSANVLSQVLQNTDMDQVKKLATPRTKTLMTNSKINRAKSMLAAGYTQAEVADALGVSVSTISASIK